MKAAVIDAFGSASQLKVREVPKPEIEPDQILVEVHAASVNPIDWKIREGMMSARYGEHFPMVLGLDVSGVVVEVGENVAGFATGEEVYARSDNGAGKCYAEYVALNPGTVAPKPPRLNHCEAAGIPLAALTALCGLRDCGRINAGDRVLLVGASGGVGVFATQIARILGADVTGVCSGRNEELARALGANEVIDYTKEPVLHEDDAYDVIYDTVGALKLAAALTALNEGGVYMTLVPVPGIEFFVPGQTVREAGKGYFVAWTPRSEDLQLLSEWVASGELRAIIDSEYSLEDIRAAHERSQTERAVGKIIIKVRERR